MAIEKVDLVVVGAGPAGLAAATEAAQRGARVVVLDESPLPGGRLPGQIHREPRQSVAGPRRWSNGAVRADYLVNAAHGAGVRIVCGASVWGVFPGWFVACAPTDACRIENPLPTGFDTRAVVIATGAFQNSLALPGWTLPGVITAGAAQTMINVHRILPGQNAVIIGIDPLSLAVAQLMRAVGAGVGGVFLPPVNGLQFGPASPRDAVQILADLAADASGIRMTLAAVVGKYLSRWVAACFPVRGLNIEGVPLMLRRSVLSISGSQRVESVTIAALGVNGTLKPGSEQQFEADVVITSAGLSPLVELVQVAGCPLTHVPEMGGWVPVHSDRFQTPRPGLFIAGSISGVEGAGVAEIQGRIAGMAAAGYLEFTTDKGLQEDIQNQQQKLITARQATISFYPQIEAGRARMNRIWQNRQAEAVFQ
jgi:sarcosine oxidase subunit alpha